MAPIDLIILAQEICETFFLHTDWKNKEKLHLFPKYTAAPLPPRLATSRGQGEHFI